ncbi:hypothetical protein [Shewanella algae]|uniref:hypothetical protein n=1 Tax=Shewanella algae TaxID=38313 RepID=UPI0010560F86|nr:hypothetical protein [Shewanella algae]
MKQAHAELYQVRFQINEESMPDLDTDRGRKEWLFILPKEIRSVSKKYLDQLINLAKDELPNLT